MTPMKNQKIELSTNAPSAGASSASASLSSSAAAETDKKVIRFCSFKCRRLIHSSIKVPRRPGLSCGLCLHRLTASLLPDPLRPLVTRQQQGDWGTRRILGSAPRRSIPGGAGPRAACGSGPRPSLSSPQHPQIHALGRPGGLHLGGAPRRALQTPQRWGPRLHPPSLLPSAPA